MDILVIAPVIGVVALLFAFMKASFISKQEPGNDRMKEISGYIQDGAMAFLTREYKALVFFVLALFIVLFIGLKDIKICNLLLMWSTFLNPSRICRNEGCN